MVDYNLIVLFDKVVSESRGAVVAADNAGVGKSHRIKDVLHGEIVSVGVNTKISTLIQRPLQAQATYGFSLSR